MNLLLDACVFIDYLGRKEPFFSAAAQVIAAGFFGDARLWLPVQSLTDAFYVLRKYIPADKLQSMLKTVCAHISLVDLCAQDSLRALSLEWSDIEDCQVALAAEKTKADYLITRDVKDFSRSLVPPMSPEDWLQMMRDTQGLSYEMVDW